MNRNDHAAEGDPTVEQGAALTAESVHERQRRAITALIPGWYNPWVHLSIPTTLGVAVVAGAVLLMRDLRAIELLAVPAGLFFIFFFEWNAHKHVLHRRRPLVSVIYDRHELQHHVIYTDKDMAMRSRREFWLILVPAYAIMLIFVTSLPLAYLLSLVLSPNVGLLFIATAMVFFVAYEWLHLAYHLPPESAVGRLGVIAFLREHHRIHHDPRLMRHWNFNVTVPVFDWIFRTNWTPAREAERAEKRAAKRRAREGEGSRASEPTPRLT
jgi:hypothetical protein